MFRVVQVIKKCPSSKKPQDLLQCVQRSGHGSQFETVKVTTYIFRFNYIILEYTELSLSLMFSDRSSETFLFIMCSESHANLCFLFDGTNNNV
jgi:hypothetical protein